MTQESEIFVNLIKRYGDAYYSYSGKSLNYGKDTKNNIRLYINLSTNREETKVVDYTIVIYDLDISRLKEFYIESEQEYTEIKNRLDDNKFLYNEYICVNNKNYLINED